jgi:hypothetical protein
MRMKAEHGQDWDPSSVRSSIPPPDQPCKANVRAKIDFLSQLLEAAPADCHTVYDMIVSVIVVNFAAIHTTSIVSSRIAYLDLRSELA